MEAIKLNLIPNGASPVAHASQYDEGRSFRFDLFEGAAVYTLDGTEVLECDIKKPDGNIVTVAVTNTSDSYIVVETTLQMCACAGNSFGEIKITKGAKVIGTLNFILAVERSPLEGGIESDSGIYNLEAQVNQMVEDAVATQYDSDSVIFDNLPTAGHGIPHTVTSEGIGNAIDEALEMTAEASGAIANFESEYALPLRDLEIEINMVETGDGNPKSPTNPYTISGFTGANIRVVGSNLTDEQWELGTIDGTTGANTPNSNALRTKNYIPIEPNTTYYFYIGVGITTNPYLYDQNKQYIGRLGSYIKNQTFTTPSNAYYIRLGLPVGYGTTYNNNVSINYPATDTEYHAYDPNSKVIPITWNEEAGTVYGAKSKPIVGGLAVTYGVVDLGSLTWSDAAGNLSSSSGISALVKAPSANTQAFNGLCSCYVVAPRTGIADKQISVQTNGNIVISDTDIAGFSGVQIQAYLTGFILVYELATPQNYQLAPTGNITAIAGTNNIFADTNGDTTLEYYAGNGADTAQVAEEIAGVVVADYAAKVVKTKNGTFTNLLASPLNSVWLVCCQKITDAGSGFVGIYSFDGVNLNPCIVYISDLSASFDSATGTLTVKHSGSTTDVYGSAFRLA